MADTWSLLRRIGAKKMEQWGDNNRRPSDRLDRDLPLGIRVRGMVDIPEPDFIIAGDALKIKHPGISNSVLSFGVVIMGKYRLHRFYLESPQGIYVLQTMTGAKGRVEDCKLFMPLDEIYPDDWDFWLSPRDGYIGYSEFQIKDGTTYYRAWEDPDREVVLEEDARGNRISRIPPVEMLETVYFDPYGEDTETAKYDSMLYGRVISDDLNEFLMVSVKDDKDGASVQIMVGLQLEPLSIKVI